MMIALSLAWFFILPLLNFMKSQEMCVCRISFYTAPTIYTMSDLFAFRLFQGSATEHE